MILLNMILLITLNTGDTSYNDITYNNFTYYENTNDT